MYNVTCFKYRATIIRKYWLNFSYSYIKETKVIDLGSIKVSQNNSCVNSWYPNLTSLTRSNHDINFILYNIKTLDLIYYITNYFTKGDYSYYQLMIDVTFIRNVYNKII